MDEAVKRFFKLNFRPGAVAALIWLIAAAPTRGAEPLDVWIDCDPAFGTAGKDVDDGLALIQAFHSPELRVHGLSVVFGNIGLEPGTRIARQLVERFGPEGLTVNAGAASAGELGQENDATRALIKALETRPMRILALGPMTNIATVLRARPDLNPRIQELVIVAGRRPGQKFVNAPRQPYPHRDFNFELDPESMRVALESGLPITLAPWEVSSHVWITRKDLSALAEDVGGPGELIAQRAAHWLQIWINVAGAVGFNPFDTLAVGWLTSPELFKTYDAGAWIERDVDDRVFNQRPPGLKPYLLVDPGRMDGARVKYLYKPDDKFHDDLMGRLVSAPSQAAAERSPAAAGGAR